MKIDFKFVPSFSTSINPNFKKSIFFMHIPKSGGTTIDHIFIKLSNILKNFNFIRCKYDSDTSKIRSFSNLNNNPKPIFLSGHLDYDFTDNLKNFFKCTIVREPVSRVISHYKFNIFKMKKTPQTYSFENFINDEVNSNRDNLITRHFCGLLNKNIEISNNDKKNAIKNIHNFDSISTIENWDNFLSDILTEFGLPSIIYSKFQQHNYDFSYHPSKKDLDLIKENFGYDIEFYSNVSERKYNIKFKRTQEYNKDICIVSPFLNVENKLFSDEEVKKLLIKKNEI